VWVVGGGGLATHCAVGVCSEFGTLFREAAEQSGARYRQEGFDTSVMEVEKNDLQKFLELLHSGLLTS
jgi:hypothetical protein